MRFIDCRPGGVLTRARPGVQHSWWTVVAQIEERFAKMKDAFQSQPEPADRAYFARFVAKAQLPN